MSLRITFAVLLLVMSAPLLAADNYYLQFEIFRFQQKIESGKDYVTAKEHTWSKGLQRNYLKLSCVAGAGGKINKVYSIENHFAGILLKHQVKEDALHLRLTRVDVQPRLTEIRSLPKNQCQELAPQITAASEDFVTPLADADNRNYPFGKEMNIRISLLPLDAAR